ncbi:MAG: 50S ribosomal protein L19 [Ignavibacteriales bacterium]|nr:MAG: 50S ribosomal protein L19 [Ignavibacteriaceae bacterium]MBW7873975.1 50S ribosomal protein L19 [Ignavibacteria bacterium]MCZ2143267.1 50S ribosomal protein L19 [Ignavibacteriales bacterium]MBV6444148.1 50S ribosomal protein L19 [Ignavibacteriaceae bacterium]MBZ0196166.1 50S ribosomal protein L19 [Ignavibacteriaceae bacterium]
MKSIYDFIPEEKREDFAEFNVGDRVRVHVRVIEGDKERLQPFEGDVISIKGGRENRSFTVRKISGGVGVERIFPFNTPKVAKVERIREGKVRRAKLYYLRELSGRAAKIKDKNLR